MCLQCKIFFNMYVSLLYTFAYPHKYLYIHININYIHINFLCNSMVHTQIFIVGLYCQTFHFISFFFFFFQKLFKCNKCYVYSTSHVQMLFIPYLEAKNTHINCKYHIKQILIHFESEEFEDTKGIIRISISKLSANIRPYSKADFSSIT